MSNKQKLELTWIGKEKRPKLEPRILLEDPEKSYHAKQRYSESDIFDNRLIFGDNLLALKALEQEFTGMVKCIYIDPPYNTGSAFEYYDDGVEHSIWLGLMRDRLELLYRLLTLNGSIWISIDDNEYPYLRVLCDEIFGRANFVCTVIWEKRKSRENRRAFSFKHDYIVVYARDKFSFEKDRNPVPMSQEVLSRYKNPDNDPRGAWQSVAITAQSGHATASQFYQIVTPNGRTIDPPAGNCWRFTEQRFKELVSDDRIYFGPSGGNVPRQKKFLKESEDAGLTPETIWYADDVGTNDSSKRHSNVMFDGNGFDNPKPEELLARILHIASNENDLVLDSFSGSGTTGAVAHKMGRRWIMVELGEHCNTHIVPRLRKVIDGEDKGGVTETANWKGGGGFRYYKLAPSLIVEDRWGNSVINPEYNSTQLAEALCKLEGFAYAPSETLWWQHGNSSERDFIYVTTQNLSAQQLQALADEVGSDQSLLVCCAAFHGVTAAAASTRWPNLTLKKIPKMVLSRCEWGHDDYSLNVANLPIAEMDEPAAKAAPAKATKKKKAAPAQGGLFGDEQ
ncbi:site-specific DNA-methyltransferase [Cellvibrio sp. pealriver]|uniref:site-specific DNA-methyltransferase n=1 Tax=Cellvibrio sp. pealriver TaxID=1622269 RepID=UPI00066FB35D|nr:site-specific DNA-methyltransferase [Cellvibrio sp. pealriver]